MFYAFSIRSMLKKLVFIALILAVVRLYLLPNYILPVRYSDYVERYCEEYGLSKWLVYSVIYTESKFDSDAVSVKGARGLMQLTEGTGAWAAEKLGIEGYSGDLLFEPAVNIRIGCWYIDNLRNQFGDMETALAAYNAGSGNVSGWLDSDEHSLDGVTLYSIPFGETDRYVKKIEKLERLYELIY